MKHVDIMQEYVNQTTHDRKADAVSANYQRLRPQLQQNTAQALSQARRGQRRASGDEELTANQCTAHWRLSNTTCGRAAAY